MSDPTETPGSAASAPVGAPPPVAAVTPETPSAPEPPHAAPVVSPAASAPPPTPWRQRHGAGLALLLLALGGVALIAWLLRRYQIDHAFTVFRLVAQFSAGQGFSYNPGAPFRVGGGSAPWVALLGFLLQFDTNLPALAGWASAAAIGLGAAGLWWALYERENDSPAPGLAALCFVAFPLLWMLPGLDTAFWLALCLLGLAAYLHRQPLAAALLLGLALWMRPDTLALILALALDWALYSRKDLPLMAPGLLAGLGAAALLFNLIVYPGDLPPAILSPGPDLLAVSALDGLAVFFIGLFGLSPAWLPLLILLPLGAFAGYRRRAALALFAWPTLMLAAAAIFTLPALPWLYAPLIPLLAAFSALAIDALARWAGKPWARLGVLALALLLAGGAAALTLSGLQAPVRPTAVETLAPARPSATLRQAGEWIAAQGNIAPDALVAVGSLGVLGYVADRPLIDLDGSLDPDVAAARLRGDPAWLIHARTPETLVLAADSLADLGGYDLTRDAWFMATYIEVQRIQPRAPGESTLLIFQRIAQPAAFTDTLIGLVNYPEGPTLNRLASDFALAPLDARGGAGRFRLEWLLPGPADESVRVAGIRIRGADGSIIAVDSRPLRIDSWPRRTFISTYHSLSIPTGAAPGVYSVEVGLGPDPISLNWRPVTEAKVPFETEVFLGALSGLRADFGDLAIDGYRLARTEEGLDLLIMWVAQRRPLVDYIFLVEVRDMQGDLQASLAAAPHGGAYPTSIWSPQERVPETFLITQEFAPGSYEIYVSLLAPDGSRVPSSAGQESVLVSPLSISP